MWLGRVGAQRLTLGFQAPSKTVQYCSHVTGKGLVDSKNETQLKSAQNKPFNLVGKREFLFF